MQFKNINRIFGFIALLVSLVVYMLTVQDSVPFWDCSEFAAAAIWQQVPHPPGAPLFLMIGKLFDVLIPFGDAGWKMNMVSVVSSAVTVWLLYHIAVMVINNMIGKRPSDSAGIFAVCGSALIGALAFTFSDTFWFNAVESEVYAMSTLFVAVVVYLLMLWNERADEPGHEKYLLLIMYIIGLAIGVHLLAVLAIFTIGLVVYFRKYTTGDKIKFNLQFFLAGLAILIFFGIIYKFVIMSLPAMMAGNFPLKNTAQDYVIRDSFFMQFVLVAILVGLGIVLYRTYNTKKSSVALLSLSLLFTLMGYTTYAHIMIRSNANPPMNENEPKDFTELARYIGREQYGNDASWPRRVKSSREGAHFVRNYVSTDAQGDYLYGEWTEPKYDYAVNRFGMNVPVKTWPQINAAGELAYLFKFQMNHMYFRYLLWNFAGRISDEQDAGAAVLPFFENVKSEAERLNWDSGYKDLYPISYYAIPLLFGLFGLVFHFYRDPKMAFSFLVMFLLMGVLMAVAQQQQDPQPRERDYFYTGSFMIFSMWVGIGVFGIIDYLSKKKPSTAISGAVVALSIVVVPVNMAVGNWSTHDRTGNFIPFDYSYNILQSCEKDAILFTYGDNDTFPLWYLQDVMGVRRDIRIVNLSLANTIWYVDQLKNREPWGTEKIPIEIPDEKLKIRDELDPRAPSYDVFPPKVIKITDIPEETMKRFDSDWAGGTGTFQTLIQGQGEYDGGIAYRVQDQVVHDIVKNTRFERPVYYSNTVSPDGYCGLEKYFRYEGMALRICPVEQKSNTGKPKIDLDIMGQCLLQVDNSEFYSKTPQYGFKLRNLNDSDVYFDPVHRRLMDTYRQLYIAFADAIYDETGDIAKTVEVFDVLDDNISERQFPSDLSLNYQKTTLLDNIGAEPQAKESAQDVIITLEKILQNPSYHQDKILKEVSGQSWGPYRMKSAMQSILDDHEGAMATLDNLDKASEDYKAKLIAAGYSSSSKEVQDILRVKYSVIVGKEEIMIDKIYESEGFAAARSYSDDVVEKFNANRDPIYKMAVRDILAKINSLTALQDNADMGIDEESISQ